MKERLFRFKQFNVSHALSAMPIGVDGVLIGAWARCAGRRILDVGTGCGVIALMMAQRNAGCRITAIDTDSLSVEEAAMNFKKSPWPERLDAVNISFADIRPEDGLYDVIVSNPPYFDSGVDNHESPRTMARHIGELSPEILISRGCCLLSRDGVISMIVPAEMKERLLEVAQVNGLKMERCCSVRDHEGAAVKRVLLEFGHEGSNEERELTMFVDKVTPTSEYRELCGRFYLKF